MRVKIKLVIFLLSLFFLNPLFSEGGKWINPITDVCWKCLFPLKVAGYNVAMGGEKTLSDELKKEGFSKAKFLCSCPADKNGIPTLVGIPISFYEPTRLIDVTREPYKLVGLGGMKIKKTKRGMGAVYSSGTGARYAHYHVHVYEYPVLSLVELANDLVCTEFEGKDFKIDIPFMSELDLNWNNEKLLAYFNPEMVVFANPLAQISCAPACISSSIQKPLDALFWCAGCQGSLYPLFGFVAEYIGGIQASLLLIQRVIVKLHQWGLLKTFPDKGGREYCKKEYSLRPKRGQYKTQLVYPVASTNGPCNALGKTELFWGSGKSFPVTGEEFCYILWTERRCCLDPVKAGLKWGLGI